MGQFHKLCSWLWYKDPIWWQTRFSMQSMLIHCLPVLMLDFFRQESYLITLLSVVSFIRLLPYLWIHTFWIEPACPFAVLGIIPPIVISGWLVYFNIYEPGCHISLNPICIPTLALGFYGVLPSIKRVK